MTDQTGTPSSPEPPKLRRRLVTAAPAAAPKVKFVSPAAEGVEVVKPRFLTPELQAKLAQEQEEAARIKAEQEAAEAARIAAEKEAARVAAEEERARLAAELEKKEAASAPQPEPSVDAQIQDALAKVAEAQKALAEAQAAALAQAAGVAPAAVQTPEPSVPEPAPAVGAPKLKVFKTDAAPAAAEKSPAAAPESAVPKLKIPRGGSTSFFHGSRCGSPACGCRGSFPCLWRSSGGRRRYSASRRNGIRPGYGRFRG